ncbi:MAG: ABC transporter permease subunit [Candidatus Aminicenantes bacterium]|nr:ABC transporter permease subunit [Candidatus Aminicenantes bacterium]
MRNVSNIFRREFKSYFISPIAYIVIAVFLVVTGWLFFPTFFLMRQANLNQFFTLLPVTFAFIIPAVTMRLFSEEINVGSYEMLLTMPVSFKEIIVGKYLAAVAFVSIMLAPTFFYAVSISFIGKMDWGPVLGGFLGALLLGAAFCAIGLLASSLTRNQVIAFIVGLVTCFVLTLLVDYSLYLLPGFLSGLTGFFQYLSASHHFQNIAKGVVDSRDILYFLSVSFVALYGTALIMQEKK